MNRQPGILRAMLLSLTTVGLTGCGGGGGSGAAAAPTSTPFGATMLLDTSGGVDAPVQIRLLGVFVNDLAGASSGNLLESPVEVLLASPSGLTETISIRRLPDGVWDRATFAFDRARRIEGGSGALPLTPEFGVLVAPFATPLTIRGSGDAIVHVRHGSPLGNGAGVFGSDLEAGSVQGLPVEDVHASILADGRASVGNAAPLSLTFAPGAVLRDQSGVHASPSAWLRSFSIDDSCSLDGTFLADDRFHVRSGSRRESGRCESKVYGRISTLDRVVRSVGVDLVARRQPSGRMVSAAGTETFDAAAARILDDSSQGGQIRGFDDLAIGQFVEVEYCDGPALRAYEIEIEDGPGSGNHPEIEGRVLGVDLVTREIQLGPRGNDPLILGGRSVTTATVSVPIGLDILRVFRGGRDPVVVALRDVRSADRIWVRGRVLGPTQVSASWVRVRDDS